MITLDLSPETEARIERIAKGFKRDVASILAEAVEEAETAYAEYLANPSGVVPFSVIRAELGL